ncbi:MAG TPA: class I SAM-dependent DNA methyltransferase [Candidatus Competibacteraceae bacterium]|nr:class I SAM-dependent DNA methyltransferase [Candidatus Competibacteraceae bacterium]HRZ06036.1 class I SAM-dependent DNA methyltransferase [Candidatus Competibacteraceae bacterium]
MTTPADLADFIRTCRASTLSERSGAQSHFNTLCRLLELAPPMDADPQGEWFTFEKGVTKTGGGKGWADVWRRHCFAWEYKGKHKDLAAALRQLQQYALALDNPPLLIVSDMETIEIHTHFTDTVHKVYRLTLDDLAEPARFDLLRWAFLDPERLKPTRTREAVTQDAAMLLGGLAQRLRQRGHDPQPVAHFMTRLLFCLFAEDIGLLPNQLFRKLLEEGRRMPADFPVLARDLFRAMQRGGRFGLEHIAWFNGGLFDDEDCLPLEKADLDTLHSAAALNGSVIEPAIFGTLFERGLDPDKRSQLGAHYTDAESIHRLITPVIREPLLAEWATVKAAMTGELSKAGAKPRQQATNRLHGFLERLRTFRVLDPACGSGNFLYLALRTLKDIEHQVMLEAEALGLQRGFPTVGPEAVIGIEINPYAAELARLTVWIGEIQWMLGHGYSLNDQPILKPLNSIECRDALLDIPPAFPPCQGGVSRRDGGGLPESSNHPGAARHPSLSKEGNSVSEAAWPVADAIVGNPPFLGDKKQLAELGDQYAGLLRRVYQGRVPGGADLVCYWFEKARAQIEAGQAQRAGLVTTNSIRGGQNRKVLDRIRETGTIFNAWSDLESINEGAAVRVSLVSFGQTMEKAMLNGQPVAEIYADLTGQMPDATGGVDLTEARMLPENAGVSFIGTSKKGRFDVPGEQARSWLQSPNPHGRGNHEVLKPWVNGMDVTRRPSDMWIVDFGMDMPEVTAACFELPFAHVLQAVKPARDQVRNLQERRLWWLHARTLSAMRAALSSLSRYIATPRVAKYRLFNWMDKAVMPDSAVVAIARSDDTTFGILHSRFHELWALRTCTWLGKGNDPRYTPTTCFETFPFPAGLTPNIPAADYADDPHAQAIADAARKLNELRENWLNPPQWVDRVPEIVPGYPDRLIPKPEHAAELKKRTLTNLYNQRPTWLDHAHHAVDEAVAAAYSWPMDLSDEDILRRLLALNRERLESHSNLT